MKKKMNIFLIAFTILFSIVLNGCGISTTRTTEKKNTLLTIKPSTTKTSMNITTDNHVTSKKATTVESTITSINNTTGEKITSQIQSTTNKTTNANGTSSKVTTISSTAKQTIAPTIIKQTTKSTTIKQTTKFTTIKQTMAPTTIKQTTKSTTIKQTIAPTTIKQTTKSTTIKQTIAPTTIKQTTNKLHKITYELFGGNNNANNPESYIENGDEFVLLSPQKDNCVFLGWFTDSALSKSIKRIDDTCSTDLKLYAKWNLTEDFNLLYSPTSNTTCQIDGINNGDTNIFIPEVIDDYFVTSIAESAFEDSNITSVVFPSELKSIEAKAFKGCNLTNVVLPEEIKQIGSYAFDDCSLQYNQYNNGYYLGSVQSPYLLLVKVIDNMVDTFSLHEETIMIYSSCFEGCENLINISLNSRITTIGAKAFKNCVSLLEMNIGGNLKAIEEETFAECQSLESMTITEGVISIGAKAFLNCSLLTTISFPNSLEIIDNDILLGCNDLIKTELNGAKYLGNNTNEYLILCSVDKDLTNYSFLSGTKIIYSGAFTDCTNITSLNFTNNISYIGEGAFYNCISLNNVSIPSKIKKIEDNLFYGCSSLTNINLTENIISIGMNAFRGCSLESLSIPKNINYIGQYAFRDCSNSIGTITVDNSNLVYEGRGNCLIEKESKKLLFGGNLSSILPGIEIIGEYAFYGCTSVESIYIPNSVVEIETCAFQNCINLKNVSLQENLIKIKESAFAKCQSLMAIILPKTILEIGDTAFSECGAITVAYILSTNISMGEEVFNCADTTLCIHLSLASIPSTWPSSWCTITENISFEYNYIG